MAAEVSELLSMESRNDTVVELIGPKEKDGFGQDRAVQPGLVLKFEHITLSIKDKKILTDVSGCAKPGQVMAVMGPSGSGKTTLLNVIGGRHACKGAKATIGGQPLTKKTRRKISYVLQEDIFFPNLTLGDTLMFSAELRLEEKWPRKVKENIVQEIVDQLEINNCMKTIIGSAMVRGLSGGEKKRANIANELLTDPAVLLLDEPTSGLDSTTAYGLAQSLKRYAVKSNKTVLMTVHQPSSQMFFLFDTVMLMSKGRIAYYGSPQDVLEHFSNIGYSCDIPHYNPADFILDMAKLEQDGLDSIINESNQMRQNMVDCPILKSTLTAHKKFVESIAGTKMDQFSTEKENDGLLQQNAIQGNGYSLAGNDNTKQHDGLIKDSRKSWEEQWTPGAGIQEDISDASSLDTDESGEETGRTWMTSFGKQLAVLTQRSFIQGKSRYLSKLKLIKCLGVSLISGFVWWQIGAGNPVETQISDITALFFFITLYNSFDPLFDVLQIFPSERTVINKERMAGAYRLSAYYLAKLASELPLTLIFPCISVIIIYWMGGLNGVNHPWAFFGTLVVVICQALASQSLGLFVSAATMDFDHGLVMAVLLMIAFMLLGGFYVKNLPSWLAWMKYISPITHAWALQLYLEFDSDTRIICDPVVSAYESCGPTLNTSVAIGNTTKGLNATILRSPASNETKYVAYQEILDKNKIFEPPWVAMISLLAIMVVFRLLGYVCLRLFHKPAMK